MASRFLLRLGGGAAARGRGHLLLAGKACSCRSPSHGGALGGSGFGVPGVQGRWMSDNANINNRLIETEKRIAEYGSRLQSVEKAWVLSQKEVELAERRAEAAERRAEAAERRAQMAEERAARLEETIYIVQKRVESLSLLTSSQLGHMMRLLGSMAQQIQVNFTVNQLSHWVLSQDMAMLRDHISGIKAGYQKEILTTKNALSVTSWKIVVVLLGAFGAVIMFILPYIVSDTKGGIMREMTEVLDESLAPIINDVSELKKDKAKKWF